MSLKRSKMVSFRLSPAEYTRFRQVCAAKGVRSISDLARVAMTMVASQEVEIDPLSDQVQEIRMQVQSISLELDRISNVVEARKAARAS
jgi:uncharacterized coiled-coil protein SlyX